MISLTIASLPNLDVNITVDLACAPSEGSNGYPGYCDIVDWECDAELPDWLTALLDDAIRGGKVPELEEKMAEIWRHL